MYLREGMRTFRGILCPRSWRRCRRRRRLPNRAKARQRRERLRAKRTAACAALVAPVPFATSLVIVPPVSAPFAAAALGGGAAPVARAVALDSRRLQVSAETSRAYSPTCGSEGL